MRISSLIFIFLFAFSIIDESYSENKVDSVSAHIKKAEEYYESGDFESTFLELNSAMDELAETIGRSMVKALPASTNRWNQKKEGGDINRLGKAGVVVIKDYQSKGKDARITLTFGSPLVPSIRLLSENEFFKERKDVIKVKEFDVLFVPLPDNTGYEAYTTIGSWYLLTVRGNNCSKEDIIELLSAIDYSKLIR